MVTRRQLELLVQSNLQKMRRGDLTAQNASLQYTAHMSAYTLAAETGCEQTMKDRRGDLHDVLDIMLDAISEQVKLRDENEDAIRKLTTML